MVWKLVFHIISVKVVTLFTHTTFVLSGSAASPAPPAVTTQATTQPASQVPPPVTPTPFQAAPMRTEGRVFVSPLARKIAVDKGVDLSQVQGDLVVTNSYIV